MSIIVEIPADLEKKLEAEAAEHGLNAAEYVRTLLERTLGAPGQIPLWMTVSKGEWLKAFDEWMDRYDPTLPPLSDEGISRESIY
jgi:hypothetical protein